MSHGEALKWAGVLLIAFAPCHALGDSPQREQRVVDVAYVPRTAPPPQDIVSLRVSKEVTDDDVARIAEMIHLRRLALVGLDIPTALSQVLGKLSELTELDLSQSTNVDRIIAALPELPHLRYLSVEGCNVDDAGLRHIVRSCPNIEALILDNTGVTSLDALAHCRALRYISLAYCEQIVEFGQFGGLRQIATHIQRTCAS